MSSFNRDLKGDAILLHLADEQRATDNAALLERNGRNARTLIKSDAMRVTMIVLAAGGGIPAHHADGPITVQVIAGAMMFKVGDASFDLVTGDLLSVGKGIQHEVASTDGATFLLTIAGSGSTGPG